MAWWVIAEPLRTLDLVGVGFGTLGMLLIVKPWQAESQSAVNELIGSAFSLLGAFCNAYACVLQRKISLGGAEVHWILCSFWFFVSFVVIGGTWGFFLPQEIETNRSLEFYLYCVAMTLMMVCSQPCYVLAMKYIRPGTVAVLNFLGIPLGYLIDWMVLNQDFGYMELTGAVIIFGTNVAIGLIKARKMKQP